jgi:serine/threonine-protein kinase PknK
MGQPRVIIADDDVLLREGLASLLDRSGMRVLGQAGDAQQLLDLVDQRLPDLVAVDIRMPPTNTTEGLAAARTIRQTHPQVGIVVLSAHVAVEHAMELLGSGRRVGYLLKSGSATWRSSSTRWGGSRGAGRWWTPRW